MTSKASSSGAKRPTILRFALVLGDKIIEEKLIRTEDVTIGQSRKNTFNVPLEELPKTWKLVSCVDGNYEMRITSDMKGRISQDDKTVETLKQIRERAKKEGDAYVVSLSPSARGKVQLGQMKLLFQSITEPPVIPLPTLPASLRGTLAERLDPQLTSILGGFLGAFALIVILAFVRDVPKTETFFDKSGASKYIEPDIEIRDIVPLETQTEVASAGDAKNKKPAKAKPAKAKPAGGRGGGKSSGKSSAEKAAAAERAVAAAIEALGFEGDGDGPGGMSSRSPGGDLGQQVGQIARSGQQVTIGRGSGDRVRKGADSGVGTGSGPDLSGAGSGPSSAGKKTKELVPKSRVSIGGKTSLDDTSLNPSKVVSIIKAKYMRGLVRCHQQALKRDPKANGKVTLNFTVGESGRLIKRKAKGFDQPLTKCIETRMATWRFPIPKDEDGDATDAAFKVTLALQGT